MGDKGIDCKQIRVARTLFGEFDVPQTIRAKGVGFVIKGRDHSRGHTFWEILGAFRKAFPRQEGQFQLVIEDLQSIINGYSIKSKQDIIEIPLIVGKRIKRDWECDVSEGKTKADDDHSTLDNTHTLLQRSGIF